MNITNKKWLLSLVFVMVLAVALVGCTGGTDDADDTQTGDPDTGDKVEETTEDAKDAVDDAAKDVEDTVRNMTYDDIKIRPEEAFDKFMELHPEAKVESLDLDKDLMDYEYVVEGYDTENEYEVKINPANGEVISDEMEMIDLDDERDEITRDHAAKVDNLVDKAKAEDGSDSQLDEWDIYP